MPIWESDPDKDDKRNFVAIIKESAGITIF